jgi:ATP-dependent exoDNAse (exonuclease V) beta subunit
MDACANALRRLKLPHQVRKRSGDFNPRSDVINVMTMRVSKGLEFPIVALPGVGQMPVPGEDEAEQARLFYVAATRATHQLYVTVSGDCKFGQKLIALAAQTSSGHREADHAGQHQSAVRGVEAGGDRRFSLS